ncbi:bifunctional biotin--[acetyl-CoA-carboxylase] ligase/biotin operon repressor BirA [Thorsellia anophelis]|uniref:BirA family transcriptional regulator, biotin operon repressor / biotin-[acetyl-CoA-carboxylase] ligase n=1 Tax=Thorsellia anophelis DSM 18579 TaxID=1123402 RepID=A0A1I0F3A9_9GAMM|nr:bifunctional biotin--[acetyl-CoA-carboxylase] ligase/biotin operon repressor BirA [Thorsellia anophelis]SET52324.1 BirA family transcriptional regulator, biotin operon repressor / biotin-[acetyl-CoA-carboxylase] ligase [Thorsellia anophelis DSM 18579]
MHKYKTELKIIQILSDGKYHSGTSIASQLNITRSAVSQSIAKFQLWGLTVFSVKGKGYKILDKLNLFKKIEFENEGITVYESIEERTILTYQGLLPVGGTSKNLMEPAIFLRPILDSTNQYLINNMEDLVKGDACLAEYQYSARGRRGRRFYAPFGCNLYFSFYWQMSLERDFIPPLSLVIGMLTVDTLKSFGVKDLKLKWPNDIYLNDKKLGGILIETKIKGKGINIIIGIGLNLTMNTVDPQIVKQNWISLIQMRYELDKNALAIELRKNLFKGLVQYQLKGFNSFFLNWPSYDCFNLGAHVTLSSDEEVISGTYRGIDRDGSIKLEVETPDSKSLTHGIITRRVGDISLRKTI